MFTCIFCLLEFEDNKKSEEHVFPKSIGGSFTIYHVCNICNSKMGEKDTLINNWFTDFERNMKSLAGYKGNIPNPLEKGVLATNPEHKIQIRTENGKLKKLHTVTNVEKEELAGGSLEYNIRVDASNENEIPKILANIKKNWAKKGFQVNFSKPTIERKKIKNPEIKHSKSYNIAELDNGIFRGILKIAYEVAWYFLGDTYLKDKTAKIIRASLMSKNFSPSEHLEIEGSAHLYTSSLEDTGIPLQKDFHYALFIPKGLTIWCYVKIFALFEGWIKVFEGEEQKSFDQTKIIELNPIKRTHRIIDLPDYIGEKLTY